MQERVHRKREALLHDRSVSFGPFIILHGCRTEDERLYSVELESALALGAISKLHYALSRSASQPKRYVQDLILPAEGEDLAPEEGIAAGLRDALKHPKACLYICGDINMAGGVEESFKRLIGSAAVKALREDGRYREEIFGSKAH